MSENGSEMQNDSEPLIKMKIDKVELHRVRLELVRPFRTSSAYRTHIEHILVRLIDSDGADGWG